MNIKTGLWSLGIASAFLSMASCSGSSESNDAGGSSETAGAGAGKAGSANSGGSASSSGGGASGTSGGAVSTGGTKPSGGASGGGFPGGGASAGFPGGGFDFGGAGFDPADFMCNPKPKVGTACAATDQPCADGTNVCYCASMKWACIDISGLGLGGAGGTGGGIGQIVCPADPPMSGDPCQGFGACPYGQNKFCGCLGTSWTCN